MSNRAVDLSFFSRDSLPRICVPITGRTHGDILDMARAVYGSSADFAEWRVDYFEKFRDIDVVNKTLSCIKDVLVGKPLLFTFRTAHEGGEADIDYNAYSALLTQAAVNADMVDIEIYYPGDIKTLIGVIKEKAVVIGSYHDFNSTPGTEEIVGRLVHMYNLGADIPKIAVMPQNKMDVLRLMEASLKAKETLGSPVITMSMSGMGVISRIAAESTGSAVTFGCIGTPSAPGQIEADLLGKLLDALHVAGKGN